MNLLQKGDTVAFVAPSGCINPHALDKSIAYFQNLGLNVKIMPHVFDAYRYMAGTDTDRAQDINCAFRDTDIKAIFCVRGGAGSTKILDLLDYNSIKNNPKPTFGLSDSTALQNALYAKTGHISFTGFLPIFDFKDGDINPDVAHSLENILKNKKQTITKGKMLRPGKAEAELIGGCLSVLVYLCGTPYLPELSNKILILEDIGEKTYSLELKLNQLAQQPGFGQIKGIIFGKFTNCVAADAEDGTVEEILKDFAKDLKIPVLYDFPYGHIASRYLMPIGGKVMLDASQGLVETFPV